MPVDRSLVACHIALAMAVGGWLAPSVASGQPALASEAAQRGYQLLLQRQDSGCVLCHRIPGLPVGGDIGPSLHGLAARGSASAVRERIADPRRFNPDTLMPAYLSLIGLTDVAQAYQGKTILTEQGLDDIVAYLMQSERVRP
jgi:sulfur-oxidizing protein SoxX